MQCFRKYFSAAVVLMLAASSAMLFVQDDSADAEAEGYDAQVTPFTFPESDGIPVLEALEQAERSIDVAMYILTSTYVLSLLYEKQTQGVQVRIVVEGQPEYTYISHYKSTEILRNIVDAGGQVHIINYEGFTGDKAYSFFHNKYAVIDGETVVVTSENWAPGNFESGSGNRGWGAVVESAGYAQYMEENLFQKDFDLERESGDVKDLLDVYPDLAAYTGKLGYAIGEYSTSTFSAKVYPVHSPDNSWDMTKALMGSASERLYCEELSLADDYVKSSDSPYGWLVDASGRGADTRLVIYTGDDNESIHPQTDKVRKLNNDTDVIASGSPVTDEFTFMHNKGIIADDKVMVGSINWTPTSLGEDREVSVIIQSQEVSDYFAGYFLWDLYTGYVQGGDKEVCKVTYDIDGERTVLTYIKGDKILLPEGPAKDPGSIYTYEFSHWDGYTEGMTAEKDITLTAVFKERTALDDHGWFVYLVAVLAVLGAIALCWWYLRHGRN